MILSRPGSFFWLVSHDLRLAARRIRGMFGVSSGLKIGLILGAALGLFHLLAWPLATRVQTTIATDGPRAAEPWIACAFFVIVPWIISQALTNATRALYSRGDLDLLMASPLSAAPIFGARAVAVCVESIISVAIFVLPIANMLALTESWHWLAIYPALLGCGFLGTAIGLALALGLFAALGPRRTRVAAQILAATIGAGFALGLQALSIMPPDYRASLSAMVAGGAQSEGLSLAAVLAIPVRAVSDDMGALMFWLAFAASAFGLVTLLLAHAFVAGAISTAGMGGAREKPVARGRAFRGGTGASLRRKEWRLLSRDPWLLSQIGLQIIYTLPVSLVLWKSLGPDSSVALAVAPAIVVVAAQVAASLAWLTISSEDAPEFLITAPLAKGEVSRRKLEAVAAPVALILAIPLIGMMLLSPVAALITALFAAAAAASTILLNVWRPVPGQRGDVMRRHSQSKLVGLMEHCLALFWAVGMALAGFGSGWAALPVGLALGLLWLNRPRSITI